MQCFEFLWRTTGEGKPVSKKKYLFKLSDQQYTLRLAEQITHHSVSIPTNKLLHSQLCVN